MNNVRKHRPTATPSPSPAGPTANDQLAAAIVAHLARLKPRTNEDQQFAALRMLRARDLGAVPLAKALELVDAYAAEEMFFDLATFRAAFDKWFRAPDRAVVNTEGMFAKWRREADAIALEQRQIDDALGRLSDAELRRIRDEIADEIQRRPFDPAKKVKADEQRADNAYEASRLRKSDPTRPGVARATVYARVRADRADSGAIKTIGPADS